MIVLSVEHTKESIRGFLTRFLFELRPGVFVGNLSVASKELVVKTVLENDPDIDMMIAESKQGKINFTSYGSPTREIVNLEGLTAIAKKINKFDNLKAKPSKSLLSHLFETAMVTKWLLEESELKPITKILCDKSGLDQEKVVSLCQFLAAMHDIGKIHPSFQEKLDIDDEIVKSVYSKWPDKQYEKFRHEIYSFWIFKTIFKELDCDQIDFLASVLLYHHQGKQKGFQSQHIEDKGEKKYEEDIINYFISELKCKFLIDESILTEFFENKVESYDVFALLTGIVMISDWIASSEEFNNLDYNSWSYINDINQVLSEFGKKNNILHTSLFNHENSFDDMFNGFSPRPIQQEIINLPKKDYDCILIEAPMGEGKTEAGLYAAMKFLENTDKEGIYVAMPTGSTAQAMEPRINELMNNIGVEFKTQYIAGDAWLRNNDNAKEISSCVNKLKLFPHVSVGTVDQILKASQNVKFNEMYLSILATKVILIDEIHSYDSYTFEFLKLLLKYLKNYHVPVILMSATLSLELKKELLEIYTDDTSNIIDAYPLITAISSNNITQVKCKCSNKSKSYSVSRINEDLDSVLPEIIDIADLGTCVSVISNTVNNAIELYKELKKIKESDEKYKDIELYLLHARMPISLKESKTKHLINLFGKNRSNRPKKAIVVATPILEMSIDVDFDAMYTELSPSDSILQRIGRVTRHSDKGTARERIKFTPFIKIYNCNAKLYNKELIEKSSQVLSSYSSIIIPDNIVDIINHSYENIKSIKEKDEELQRCADAYAYGKPNDEISDRLLEDKEKEKETRYKEYKTTKIFVGTDKEYQKISPNLSLEESIEIYKNTVVNVPVYNIEQTKENKLNNKYFDDVYDGRLVYGLNDELGAFLLE